MPNPNTETVAIRVEIPRVLDDAIESAAFHQKVTKRTVVIKALSKHLRVAVASKDGAAA